MATIVTIIGKVVESINETEGIPLVNCKILPNPGIVGFAANVNGDINAPHVLTIGSTYSFTFTSVGYTSKTISKTITNNILDFGTIKLEESNETLDEFEVVVKNPCDDGIMGEYIVVKGDNLSKISRNYPIDGVSEKQRVDQIYKANPFLKGRRIESNDRTYFHGFNYLQDKNLLFPGDVLNIPCVGTPLKNFDLIGMVIDKETNDPIEGATVKTNVKKPGKSESTTTDVDGKFQLNGTYVPVVALQRPLIVEGSKGDAVRDLQEILAIKVDGDFGPNTKASVETFQGQKGLKVDGKVGEKTWIILDNLGNENKKTFLFDVIASKIFYSTERYSPFNLDESIKDVEIIIPLENQKISIKKAIIEQIVIPPPVIKGIEIAQKLKDAESFAIKDLGNQIIDRIRQSLIPQVLQLIAQFGIGKAQEALGKKMDELNTSCPANLDDLNKIIRIKNDLTRILQNIFNTLNAIKIGVDFTDKSITAGQIVLDLLKTVVASFPVAGLGAPDPSKALLAPGGTIDKIDKLLKKLKVVTSGLLMILTLITTMLAKLIAFLNLLDALIQKCHIEGALPNEQVPTILFPPGTEKESNNLPIVNGFTLDTEVETTQSTIKRKRGIAKSPSGVIMLKGEWSFSSNDQILMDELTFYIKQNNLKAD